MHLNPSSSWKSRDLKMRSPRNSKFWQFVRRRQRRCQPKHLVGECFSHLLEAVSLEDTVGVRRPGKRDDAVETSLLEGFDTVAG